MLLTQKYHSAADIDAEFIPSLEELLSECVPSFDWIKNFEQTAPEQTHFAYYLFFGQRHNSPIGFAQVALEAKETSSKKSFLSKWITPKKTYSKLKTASWKMPGSLNEGLVFEPMYIKDALGKTKNLFQEYLKREDIEVQSLCFSEAFSDLKNIDSVSFKNANEVRIPNTLVKNQKDYETYLKNLPSETAKTIKSAWKEFYKNEMKLGEFHTFKDIFSYRKDSVSVYKKLKNDPLIKKYKNEKCTYLTIEKDNQVEAIIFYIKGFGHHYFYDYLILNPKINQFTIDQLVIMKFYETNNSDRLHLLKRANDIQNYEKQGFTTRSQIHLSIS